jgi:hypothetical protein
MTQADARLMSYIRASNVAERDEESDSTQTVGQQREGPQPNSATDESMLDSVRWGRVAAWRRLWARSMKDPESKRRVW